MQPNGQGERLYLCPILISICMKTPSWPSQNRPTRHVTPYAHTLPVGLYNCLQITVNVPKMPLHKLSACQHPSNLLYDGRKVWVRL